MFEVLGLLFLRLIGFGWLWGKDDIPLEHVYGNGSPVLFGIGFAIYFLAILGLVYMMARFTQ